MANHTEVAHAWAHQTGKSRKGFNMFYEGRTIYSYGYHFPIATITEDASGRTVVLRNSAGYSVSTGKHKNYVASACSHMVSFEVPHVGVYGQILPERHRDNFEYHVKAAGELARKATRARTHGDWYLENARRHLDIANAYSEAFALGFTTVTLETLGIATAELEARLAAARAAREAADREETARRYAKDAEDREAWLAGNGRWYGTALDGSALLRVKGDMLETSQGASVPLAHAIKVFRFVKLCRDKGTAWHRNGHTIRVGHFQVDAIDEAGNFRAGCHTINWPECERIAAAINVLNLTPSDDAVEPSHVTA